MRGICIFCANNEDQPLVYGPAKLHRGKRYELTLGICRTHVREIAADEARRELARVRSMLKDARERQCR